jgi:hypothetical protein
MANRYLLCYQCFTDAPSRRPGHRSQPIETTRFPAGFGRKNDAALSRFFAVPQNLVLSFLLSAG